MQRRLFALEAFVLALPALAFLAFTFSEVWRLTKGMLHLRSTSNPEITLLQPFSALAYWAAGAAALCVLGWLVIATIRKQTFRVGIAFWFAAIIGAALAASMVGPFGAALAAVVSAPLALLAAHSATLQAQDRKLGKVQSAA